MMIPSFRLLASGLAVLSVVTSCAAGRPVPAGEPPASPEGGGVSLHLTLRVSEAGSAEVVNATELPGEVVFSDAVLGDYLYGVSRSGRTVAAESLPDPFEARGYAPPPDPALERRDRLGSATIVVRVPGVGLSGPLESLAITLYRIHRSDPPITGIDPPTLDRLEREKRLTKVAALSGKELASQIRRLGRKAPAG